MTNLRILWRVPACIVATAFWAVVTPIGGLLLRNTSGRFAKLGAKVAGGWGRSMCAILGVERRVTGDVPDDGVFLVASNHVSYLDILVLGSIYSSKFVAKREIATWPLFGWVARGAGTIFIDRGQPKDVVRAGREMSAQLDRGVPLTLFPEGRSSSGAAILPFQPSLLEPAARAGVPCYAATIRYETPGSAAAPSDTVCWHNGAPFPGHFVRMASLPKIVASVRFAEDPVRSADRKELARTLWESATRTFEPVRQS